MLDEDDFQLYFDFLFYWESKINYTIALLIEVKINKYFMLFRSDKNIISKAYNFFITKPTTLVF